MPRPLGEPPTRGRSLRHAQVDRGHDGGNMTESLQGRAAVVTGAARGIGRACAVRLAERGADVAVVDIDLRSGERYADEPPGSTTEQIEALGRRALGFQADLTDEAQAHHAITEA